MAINSQSLRIFCCDPSGNSFSNLSPSLLPLPPRHYLEILGDVQYPGEPALVALLLAVPLGHRVHQHGAHSGRLVRGVPRLVQHRRAVRVVTRCPGGGGGGVICEGRMVIYGAEVGLGR